VNHGSEIGTEISVLEVFCQNELEILRKTANQNFQDLITKNHSTQEAETNKIINEKNEEIKELRERLENLLNTSPNVKENIKAYDSQRKEAEENTRKINEEAKIVIIPEMVTKEQINGMLNNILEELNDIKEEIIQNSNDVSKGVEAALGQSQYMYKVNIKALIESMKTQFQRNLDDIILQYHDKENNIKKAYEAEKNILIKMIDEIKRINSESEKARNLEKMIHGIYTSNPDNSFIRNRSFILYNVKEIRGIKDLMERRNKVEELYNKLKLFSILFGREDLGVKVKTSDLEKIKLWLDRTNIIVILNQYVNLSFSKWNNNLFNGSPQKFLPNNTRPHSPLIGGFMGSGPKGEQNDFNGSDIGKPLLHKKEVLENQINSLNGTNRNLVLAQLNSIFEKNAADNYVSTTLTHPFHWRSFNTEVIDYHKNGEKLGYFWNEHQGANWGYSEGIFGNVPWTKNAFTGVLGFRKKAFSDISGWKNVWSICANHFKKDLDETINAIKNRAILLFDFETNPDSPLQSLYQESNQINPSIIDFPSSEMEDLIKNCNEFIKMII